MDDTKMTGKNYHGYEPWVAQQKYAERFFEGNYVKVIDVQSRGDLEDGRREYRFLFIRNFVNSPTSERSSLAFSDAIIAVEGVKTWADVFRVRREFEVQANKIVNGIRAKKPNFPKLFQKINLSKVRWGHWYPGLTDEHVRNVTSILDAR